MLPAQGDQTPARRALALGHLGPGHGDVEAQGLRGGDGHPGLLRDPMLPGSEVATRTPGLLRQCMPKRNPTSTSSRRATSDRSSGRSMAGRKDLPLAEDNCETGRANGHDRLRPPAISREC